MTHTVYRHNGAPEPISDHELVVLVYVQLFCSHLLLPRFGFYVWEFVCRTLQITKGFATVLRLEGLLSLFFPLVQATPLGALASLPLSLSSFSPCLLFTRHVFQNLRPLHSQAVPTKFVNGAH